MSAALKQTIERWYESMDGNSSVEAYHTRHGTESAGILTNYDDEHAGLVADYLRERVEGKIVVEIGAGIGLLACHVAMDARCVYAIEVDPCWAASFVWCLYENKPANLTFIFGKAEEAPPIAADVAFFCTHSGRESMHRAATLFAPEVIDVYAELMKDDPKWKAIEPLTR
jgi:tRNA G37 N-methylase Trm5